MLAGCWALVGLFVTYTKPEFCARGVGETAHDNKHRVDHKKSDFLFISIFSSDRWVVLRLEAVAQPD
jgi:hypothetical protein